MNNTAVKNKVLIVAPYQFGELSDCYYWAKYLVVEGYEVTYFGYRYKYRRPLKRSLEGIRNIPIMRDQHKLLFIVVFMFKLWWEIIRNKHVNIIICRFPHAEIFPILFPKKNIVLDIRTLSVSPSSEVRKANDLALQNMTKHFKACSYVSEGVRKAVNAPNKAYILPLGAEVISSSSKSFDSLKLLYIGTFINRNLDVFLRGLFKFKKTHNIDFTFDIIGGGSESDENQLRNLTKELGLNEVSFRGYLTHDEAKIYFDECNVGVSFVPITEYYDCQPPTKMYEYLLSGMACIATDTKSSRELINASTGVLIQDNIDSVCDGLCRIVHEKRHYHSETIRNLSNQYHWHTIIKKYLLPMFL